MAGPEGDLDKARAGEEGEYHHSKNLMKKMAVGNRILREFRRSRGNVVIALRKNVNIPLLISFPALDGKSEGA